MSIVETHLISELLDAAIAAGADGADAGVARSEGRSVSVRLGKVEASERAEEIDAALRRIDEDEFGYCSVTGEPISLKRLDARPIATMSLEAQERHERREKVHRDD